MRQPAFEMPIEWRALVGLVVIVPFLAVEVAWWTASVLHDRIDRWLTRMERRRWWCEPVQVDARLAGVVLGLVIGVLARAVCS